MSISDFFNGNKKYTEGMEAGAKPFEDKYSQYAKEYKRFNVELNKIQFVCNKTLNTVEASELKRIYGPYIQADLKILESNEKILLISLLYTLSNESINELQQSYIRSVQNYLKITNTQQLFNFSELDTVNNLTAHKAIFQSCIEYLSLSSKFTQLYNIEKNGDKLFSHFRLNMDDIKAIYGIIKNTCQAIGKEGLAKRYDFAPPDEHEDEQENEQEDMPNNNVSETDEPRNLFNRGNVNFSHVAAGGLIGIIASKIVGNIVKSVVDDTKKKPKGGKGSFSATGGLSY